MNTNKKCDESPIGCGLEKYTGHEISNFRNSRKIEVAEDLECIRNFVCRAVAGDIDGKKLLIGKIGYGLAQRIYLETRIDLFGYNLELRSNQMSKKIAACIL